MTLFGDIPRSSLLRRKVIGGMQVWLNERPLSNFHQSEWRLWGRRGSERDENQGETANSAGNKMASASLCPSLYPLSSLPIHIS